MTDSFDVIVLGGGAVGSACARELARTGRRVGILERGDQRGAAWQAAAGMLAPQIETDTGDPLFDLGLAGRERTVELAAELRESTGIDIGLWQSGIARLAMDEKELAELRSAVAWQRQQGHLCDWLDAEEVRARWPWCGPSHGALWAPEDGAVDPVELVRALRADAERHGARLIDDTALGLAHRGERISGVYGALQRYDAEQVVVATGAWAGRLEGLPRPLSVEPVRGQMAALPWPDQVPPAILFSRRCYLVHRAGEAVVGSTMEYVGFQAEVTSAGLARVFSAASTLCPALARLEVNRTWAGLRPVTPDGRPIIGAEPRLEGLWYATGHGRNGILLAGVTGVIIRQLLDRQVTFEELNTLAPDRFWSW